MIKLLRYSVIAFMLLVTQSVSSQGRCVPFFRNFTSKEYNAHNRNFDIACDDYGTVFIANFEGLLYYDGASWRKIHTPGISRVTCLAKDQRDRIWFGGYNVFGYLIPDAQGRLKMKSIVSDISKSGFGEVDFIKASGNDIYVHTISGRIYKVGENEKLIALPKSQNDIFIQGRDSVASITLPNKRRIVYSRSSGIHFDAVGQKSKTDWTSLSDKEGLISNSINNITFNKANHLWGATDEGLFCIEAVSPYAMINDHTGLSGEVNCITKYGDTVYFGTMTGLFFLSNSTVQRIGELDLACWQFDDRIDDKIYAATSKGVYLINSRGVTHLTENNTLSVCMGKGEDFYTGEFDGIYHNTPKGAHTLVASIEKVKTFRLQGTTLTAENIYGEVWEVNTTSGATRCLRQKARLSDPKILLTDYFGTLWSTDNTGKGLKQQSKNAYASNLAPWTNPFKNKSLNALCVSKDGDIWVGGPFGAILLNGAQINNFKKSKAEAPYIREITIMIDSVLWGGYGADMRPKHSMTDIELPSSCKHISLKFSTKNMSLVQPTRYRHRINGGRWSAWTEDNEVVFNNPFYGRTTVEVQSLDLFGRISDISRVEWYLQFPVYVRWWALLIYILLIVYGVTLFFKWRTKRLEREKQKLEGIVAERTSELSKAYTEQQKISEELSVTLDDLKKTQDDLVRMERSATAGKLTQGLIDRILNPINYINNFSKLTSGLAKDLSEDIEDEKDNMSEDNYEDCLDILDMMRQNLTKIEEHGVNTTRTLRAMEAMLNNHIGQLVEHDIVSLARQSLAVTSEYFKADIQRCGISMQFECSEESIIVNIDAESINKVLISTLSNSVYGVVKKFNTRPFEPVIKLTITKTDEGVDITLRDNGIGIEKTIIAKIFDPFFTTKPTGEASGVGLYLAHEIITDHKGTISVESEKDIYCEIKIKL